MASFEKLILLRHIQSGIKIFCFNFSEHLMWTTKHSSWSVNNQKERFKDGETRRYLKYNIWIILDVFNTSYEICCVNNKFWQMWEQLGISWWIFIARFVIASTHPCMEYFQADITKYCIFHIIQEQFDLIDTMVLLHVWISKTIY